MSETNAIWINPTSELLLRTLDNVAHPVFVKDTKFRIVFSNHAFAQMMGRSAEELFGKTDYDFVPKEEADFFRQKDIEMFATGLEVVIDEEPFTDRAGVRHTLATTKVPLRAPTGEVTHLVGIIHDITRLKTAEEALRRANESLERRVLERSRELAAAQENLIRKERLTVLGKLAGGVAHQIRNPLASIKTAAHVLRKLRGSDPNVDQSVDIIDEEIRRADQIITDLIDYARVRSPSVRPTPVGYVIDQALGGQMIPSAIQVQIDLPELPPALVDPDHVQGALFNIFRNAIEAMDHDAGTLSIGARQEGMEIIIQISDTGPGVPPSIRKRLFDPLITSKPRGLGLGLVTARTLIEAQEGSLACISGDGESARFEVRLPVAPAP
ncbi:MAG: ATP-binding protein [Polyangiaceae bacterium]